MCVIFLEYHIGFWEVCFMEWKWWRVSRGFYLCWVFLNFDLKVNSFLVNAYNNSGVKSGCTNWSNHKSSCMVCFVSFTINTLKVMSWQCEFFYTDNVTFTMITSKCNWVLMLLNELMGILMAILVLLIDLWLHLLWYVNIWSRGHWYFARYCFFLVQ